jgi:hypothetical protein
MANGAKLRVCDNGAFNRIVLLRVNSGLTQTGVAQYHRSGQ